MTPSRLSPFYSSSLGSPAVKRSKEKWLVTIRSHDLPNEARNLVKYASDEKEQEPFASSFFSFFFLSNLVATPENEITEVHRELSDDKFVLPSVNVSLEALKNLSSVTINLHLFLCMRIKKKRDCNNVFAFMLSQERRKGRERVKNEWKSKCSKCVSSLSFR